MRITTKQLRHIIRQEILLEKMYLPRVKTVSEVQRLLNAVLEGEEGFKQLTRDNQWGESTDSAWKKFIDLYYNPDKAAPAQGETAPSKDELKSSWKLHASKLGFTADPDGAANFIAFFAPPEKLQSFDDTSGQESLPESTSETLLRWNKLAGLLKD